MGNKNNWILPVDIDIPDEFKQFVGGDPLVAQTLYRRGITTTRAARAFLNPEAFSPCTAEALPDSRPAWEILQTAVEQDHQILIWGDFDVDGQTSTALLVESLQELGARVAYHIPVRGEESHGITAEVLETHLNQGFDLLLTCDTGISEHENVLRVREAGKQVIITDHHALGKTLPPANAVVNPQRLPPDPPLRTLPGVGVAYKLMEGLYESMGKPFKSDHYLELAALGIVADVAELHKDTRYLLQKGLESLRITQRQGLQTLYRNAELNPVQLDEGHIGFQIAPRLNAVGRLGDANPMVEFLITPDSGRARVLGAQIEALNAKRRFATRQVTKSAEAKLATSPDDRRAPAIVLHHPDWPGGVVGIVASHLVERYQKPVILLTGEDPVHGSARSIGGFNITEAIASQAALLSNFGGHPMAAGLSLPAESLVAFQHGFLAEATKRIRRNEISPEIQIDREIKLDQISSHLIEQIKRLAPFGPGNPPLNFLLRDLGLVSSTTLGAQGEHRQAVVIDIEDNTQRIIWWKGGDETLPEGRFDLVCTLSESDYRGKKQVNAEWLDYRLTELSQQEIEASQFEVIDKRQCLSPLVEIRQLIEESASVQVWAEGPIPEDISGKGRQDLTACEQLAIWTSPPSQNILEAVLRKVQPRNVILFGIGPHPNTPKELIARLGGLTKFAIHHRSGQANLVSLAIACATSVEIIQVGLKLWEAMGKVSVVQDINQVIFTKADVDPNHSIIKIYQEILWGLIDEVNAYRDYFNKAAAQNIFINRQA
jgi:single-stranded-DNA-specific exonuclease